MYLPQEIIRKKRDNFILTKEEIEFFIKGIVNNTITDSQIAAFAMAVYFNKLNKDELVDLTLSMRNSGDVLNWGDYDKPIVDKHSTGGVGDLTSLVIAPVVASCGACIPMIAGRSLGHTGGTLDKLDAIPGYNTSADLTTFKKVVKQLGCAIIGQTDNLVPADKKIYSVRDISATTESLELITSSILSKKLAAGLDALVIDIKTGNGAFLTSFEESLNLSKSIVNTANKACCNTVAVVTDMSQPLANSVGNALEVIEVINFLYGDFSNTRLYEVILALTCTMLQICNISYSLEDAKLKVVKSLKSGKALEIFSKMVAELGGPKDFIENYNKYLPKASIIKPVYYPKEGIVSSVDTKRIGLTVIYLGGGRLKVTDNIDYSVGLTNIVSIGEKVTKDKPIAIVHANNEDSFNIVANMLISAISVTSKNQEVKVPKTVYEYIRADIN